MNQGIHTSQSRKKWSWKKVIIAALTAKPPRSQDPFQQILQRWNDLETEIINNANQKNGGSRQVSRSSCSGSKEHILSAISADWKTHCLRMHGTTDKRQKQGKEPLGALCPAPREE